MRAVKDFAGLQMFDFLCIQMPIIGRLSIETEIKDANNWFLTHILIPPPEIVVLLANTIDYKFYRGNKNS